MLLESPGPEERVVRLDPAWSAAVLPAVAPPAAPFPPPRRRWRLLRWAVALLLLALLVTLAWLAIVAPPARSAHPIAPARVTLLAADGHVIARRGAVIDRPVDIRDLPNHVWQPFLAIEDRRFFRHHGVDPRGVARAAWADLRAGGVREGGSTITQQLAKQVYLNADRTAIRKAREMLIAVWLEAWLSKDQILSRYLSDVYFGDNVYGLRAAARHYFGKRPEQLDLAEAAMLAGLMKAPSRLAPSTNLAGAQARAALVIAAMADAGYLDRARAQRIAPARIHLQPAPEQTDGTYFADWVMPMARDRLPEDYAAQTLRTTLDWRLQRAAEATVASARLSGAQVALVAMRPVGRVVALVGGRSYAASPFDRATQARRQPGSTFKLFVYLAALRAGMTPDDPIEDTPLTIGGWSPVNADRRYRGSITLREAFARSSNVAAARLTQRVGAEAVARTARDLGIASPLAVKPSIALGTSGVTLLELTSAYAAVARGAYPVRPHGLPDAPQGWLGGMFDHQTHLGEARRAMLLDLLSATVNQGTGRGAALSTQVYGKTGTTQDNRDALFVGFAGGLVTGVWIGRDDNQPLHGVAGGGLPATIWRRFMAQAIGATQRGVHAPANVDPDAGLSLRIPAGTLGNLSIGLRFDRHGVHLSTHPDEERR